MGRGAREAQFLPSVLNGIEKFSGISLATEFGDENVLRGAAIF